MITDASVSSDRDCFDLLIVGGGINGVGIARDAAGRGLSVLLCERGDLASSTSSASSKLVHGGLRYLEHYEFSLVRQSLSERSVLLSMAPHIVHPMRFVIPHIGTMRPAWMISAGLFMYDHLARRDARLPASGRVSLSSGAYGAPLAGSMKTGFIYSDCTVDDSRLVVLNARDAADRGAAILTRTALMDAKRENGLWKARLQNTVNASQRTVSARIIVNAGGPWTEEVIGSLHETATTRRLRRVKGSHIIVPALYYGNHAYLLQNGDGRVIFAIPYMGRFTLVGTTEVLVDRVPPHPELGGSGSFGGVAISPDETWYLLDVIRSYFGKSLSPDDIVWSFAGIRPLIEDSAGTLGAVSRDYTLDLHVAGGAASLSVFGGKLTTYRILAEKVLDRLSPYLPMRSSPWTSGSPLPGGDMPAGGEGELSGELSKIYHWANPGLLSGLIARHGTLAGEILSGAKTEEDLGEHFGHDLYAREVDYLIKHEWAMTDDDVLWRRTKHGLLLSEGQKKRLASYINRS